MKKNILVLCLLVLWPLAASWAQLRAPNEAGVAMGQWHTIVRDIEATKNLWVLLGGTALKVDGTDVIKFPGVFIFMTKGEPSGGSVGTPVNHVGFGVQSVQKLFEKVDAAKLPGVKVKPPFKSGLNGQQLFDVFTPDDLELEFTEEAGVDPYPRLPPETPIESNHIHFASWPTPPEEMRAWYVKQGFSSNPRLLGRELAAETPGSQFMRFIPGKPPAVPTKGRALDRIGFEVKNLSAFCKKLEAGGVKFEQPYSKSRHKSFASAEFTDPWGTSIELTEGLRRF